MTHTISNIMDLTNAPTPPRWFEFLLEPGRLQQHLETDGCDPSPTQLISLFFRNIPTLEGNVVGLSPNQKNAQTPATTNGNAPTTNSPPTIPVDEVKSTNNESSEKNLIDHPELTDVQIPPDSYEAKYRIKKAYALQILSLKVASFLKWDLDIICNNLTIPVQYKLLQALTNACGSKSCPEEVKKFSDLIYRHWFLRSAITYQLSTLQPQSNNTTIIYLSQLQQQQQAADSSALYSMGELFAPKSKQLMDCSEELYRCISDLVHEERNTPKRAKLSSIQFNRAKMSMPSMFCFDFRDERFNDWSKCDIIEPKRFLEAACYDLGRFFFFEESYRLAREIFEIITDSNGRFFKLSDYLKSAKGILDEVTQNGDSKDDQSSDSSNCDLGSQMALKRKQTEKYLFDCMTQFSKSQKKETEMDVEEGEIEDDDESEKDTDLRLEQLNHQDRLPENSAWYLQIPSQNLEQQRLTDKGDVLMSHGNFKQAMGCFVGSLMLITDYFRVFSKNYINEEPYITRMIQCSISLSCFTEAVALCQMTRILNYTIAFKQLNERVCNDCCDDIYECIWNITLLEYIINLHSKRGEVERKTKVIQLIGQLELNENNPEEILREAEHVRRGRFFRIMSNKYM